MAWTDLSFPSNSLLTSLKMTQLDENFDAMAAGNAGAPAVNVNSFMVSGVASIATLNIGVGLTGVSVVSGALFHAVSGFNTAQVGSFGLLDASSGVQVEAVAPATPVAGRFYGDTAIRAWGMVNCAGTLLASVGVSAIGTPVTGMRTISWATAFASGSSYAVIGQCMMNGVGGSALLFDPRSQNGAGAVLTTFQSGDGAIVNRPCMFIAVGS